MRKFMRKEERKQPINQSWLAVWKEIWNDSEMVVIVQKCVSYFHCCPFTLEIEQQNFAVVCVMYN